MPFAGGGFHQPVRAIFGIEPERQPYQQRSRSHAEADTDPLVHARHVQDNEHHEHGKQPGGEHEKVLAFQALEVHVPANPLVNFKVHNALVYRKKERRIVAATIRKIHAPNHEAAVLLVSGSPLLNFPYTFTPPINPTTAPMA